jgi:hypothetical protein
VLAALPSGARPALRLSCRAGRAAVDGHTRRLHIKRDQPLVSPAAVARMPLLQESHLVAWDDDVALRALVVTLPALARLRRDHLWARGSSSILGGLVSSLAGLTALTRLHLSVDPKGSRWSAPPLVLPWARIEVGVRGCSLRGGLPAGAIYAWFAGH